MNTEHDYTALNRDYTHYISIIILFSYFFQFIYFYTVISNYTYYLLAHVLQAIFCKSQIMMHLLLLILSYIYTYIISLTQKHVTCERRELAPYLFLSPLLSPFPSEIYKNLNNNKNVINKNAIMMTIIAMYVRCRMNNCNKIRQLVRASYITYDG